MVESSQKPTKKHQDYPKCRLEEALGIARAIQEKNSGLPFDRVRLAKSMGTTPSSSAFVTKLTSAAKYGLTEGGYNDPRISLTALGTAALESDSGQASGALVQAATRPQTFREFYELLDGRRIPSEDEALGLMIDHLGVAERHAARCFDIAVANGRLAGIVTEVNNSNYVTSLDIPHTTIDEYASQALEEPDTTNGRIQPTGAPDTNAAQSTDERRPAQIEDGRIFIAHSGWPRAAARVGKMLEDVGIAYRVVDVGVSDSSQIGMVASEEMDGCSGAVIVFGGSDAHQWGPSFASPRAFRMLLQLGAAADRFRNRVAVVVQAGMDHYPETDLLRVIPIADHQAGLFEFDLLRELVRVKMIEVSAFGGVSSPM